jgi:gentisate 1,2-dioxygenase
MQHGDLVLTPALTLHEHANPGIEPVVWLDVLDLPLVRFLDAAFFEDAGAKASPSSASMGRAGTLFGSNMLPADFDERVAGPSPIFVYPFDATRAALRQLALDRLDAHLGAKLRYVSPLDSTAAMSTVGAFAQLLPAGFETRPYRSTDSTIFLCLSGCGVAEIGSVTVHFEPNDVFVAPSWQHRCLRAEIDTILFSFSDRPVQKTLGLWREERT